MFGHDHEDKKDENHPNDEGNTIAPSSHTSDDDQPTHGAPAFDTSNISLPDDNPGSSATPADPTPPSHDDVLSPSASDDLISIKQDALHQLSPLVGHLDQTPEEKFKTTMMMIQASDDQSLIKAAFEAAKQISDDKVRAQALLDIINEINYFTQQAK